jgi:hypothetical protein
LALDLGATVIFEAEDGTKRMNPTPSKSVSSNARIVNAEFVESVAFGAKAFEGQSELAGLSN